MIDEYARLLAVAAEHEDAQVGVRATEKLIAHLKSVGRIKMLGDILRELRTLVARRRAARPVLEIADQKESTGALAAARAAGFTVADARVNESLIRGWRVRGEGRLLDRSAKRALVDIYTNVTL